ncbi:hypothetical protein L226DRAFT_526691 [Lentinus tigrinus ALCF2SS1-7]|uniref:Uncharacterized protein n=1 Tax=Lentinus tigrinus ALCF2SS1-6 TaxID=1328759 RepID=A0A5C2RUP7_9APHY|nr:hypothetical protein L227DRAFT_567394 [Lentinus tigrinus ALCF2SS1-6]RPD69227.1 hypothetical protein L226DRAFT_526691 [Lentinus tigrinus ALCF2SS1-7]
MHHDMTPNTDAANAIATAPTARFDSAPLPFLPAAAPLVVDDAADFPAAPEPVVVGSESVTVVGPELVDTLESLAVVVPELLALAEPEPALPLDVALTAPPPR